MIVDCDSCEMRDIACGDCVVSFLLDVSPHPVELAADEAGALEVLAEAALVPPLRLVQPTDRRAAG